MYKTAQKMIRLAMTALAAKTNERFRVSDFELKLMLGDAAWQ